MQMTLGNLKHGTMSRDRELGYECGVRYALGGIAHALGRCLAGAARTVLSAEFRQGYSAGRADLKDET